MPTTGKRNQFHNFVRQPDSIAALPSNFLANLSLAEVLWSYLVHLTYPLHHVDPNYMISTAIRQIPETKRKP
jgi:hypothetical protein